MSGIALALLTILSAQAEPIIQKDIVYSSPGGQPLMLDFARPPGPGPFPLVILIHGGGWRQGSRTEFAEGQRGFAGLGFATAAVQYRLAPQHRFPAQKQDIAAAIQHLANERAKFAVDPSRVGLMGGSAGGHLALIAGLTPMSGITVRAIVNVCGPTDLRTFQSEPEGDRALKAGTGRYSRELVADLLGTADRTSPIYADASPVARMSPKCPPVLTLHGDRDDWVPVSQALALHAALKAAGVKEQLFRVPGAGHDFNQWPEEKRAEGIGLAISFLSEHLKGA